MDEKPFGHDVAQETEPGQDRAERSCLRHDVEEFDLERIARFRTLDRDRTGQRVNGADLEPGEILFGGFRRDLAVDRVAGLCRARPSPDFNCPQFRLAGLLRGLCRLAGRGRAT